MQKVQGMKSAINLDPSPGSNVTPKPGFCINSIIGGKNLGSKGVSQNSYTGSLKSPN